MLNGKTKRPDMAAIERIRTALGIVSEEPLHYGVESIYRKLTPEDENLLEILSKVPEIRESVLVMAQLPERKRKIKLGEMLSELDKLEDLKR